MSPAPFARARRALLPLAALLALALPAQAHKLKVFATVEGDRVTGYAFFVGGGRAQGTDWRATGADGTEIATATAQLIIRSAPVVSWQSLRHPAIGGTLEFAREHRDVIARFGRFPHRNEALGRQSTADEIAYLEKAERYGQ